MSAVPLRHAVSHHTLAGGRTYMAIIKAFPIGGGVLLKRVTVARCDGVGLGRLHLQPDNVTL